jgi:hypothetical protein
LKNLLFSDENKDQAIGLITEYPNETILFTNVCFNFLNKNIFSFF